MKRGLKSSVVSNRSWIKSEKRGRCLSFMGLVAQLAPAGLHKMISAKEDLKRPLCCLILPYPPKFLVTPNPAKIKISNTNPFDGTKCPKAHIVVYKNLMLLYTTNQTLLCKLFPIILRGVELKWYTSQPIRSIHTYAQLETKFVSHFVAFKRQEKSNFHLLSIIQ